MVRVFLGHSVLQLLIAQTVTLFPSQVHKNTRKTIYTYRRSKAHCLTDKVKFPRNNTIFTSHSYRMAVQVAFCYRAC